MAPVKFESLLRSYVARVGTRGDPGIVSMRQLKIKVSVFATFENKWGLFCGASSRKESIKPPANCD
jgi:hypothetical protein